MNMDYHHLYGPSAPEKGWVPAPSFLLRRDRIRRLIKNITPGHLLDVGCGAGTLVNELTEVGYTCVALETSMSALEIARYVNHDSSKVTLCNKPSADWKERFDLLMACEVLEHIEDDSSAILSWKSWLKPGGLLLLSVPAHKRKWTASDEWAGHYRRYERNDLMQLLSKCGLSISHFECYGFPLANLIAPVRARMHAHQLIERNAKKMLSRTNNNTLSGVERPVETRLYPLLCSIPGQVLMRTAFITQGLFSRLDIGSGYLLTARKLPHHTA